MALSYFTNVIDMTCIMSQCLTETDKTKEKFHTHFQLFTNEDPYLI